MRSSLAALVLASLIAAAPAQADSPVADAAMSGDAAAVADLIASGADIHAAQADGTTALHWAVNAGDRETASILLGMGADPDASTRAGATPLYLAALNGDAEMIRRLLDAGADPNQPSLSNGATPLMYAARSGSIEAVTLLIDAGADLDAQETYRQTTALIWAAEEGQAEVISLLLARGANAGARSAVDVPRSRRGNDDQPEPTPEEVAAAEAARTAALDAAARGDDSLLPDNARGGVTALILAARENQIGAVEALIAGGAPVNQQSGDGSTALLVAVQNGHTEVATRLIDGGADVTIVNRKGWNPLYQAVKNRSLEQGTMPNPTMDLDAHYTLIERLIAEGADVNARLKADTEVHNAIRSTWLRETGATPFLRAAFCGDLPVMQLLLAHGADPLIATEDGTTALAALAGVGFTKGFMKDVGGPEMSLEAMELLLSTGIDVNAANTDFVSALHGAAHKNFVGGIQMLVDHGADLTAKSQRRGQFERAGDVPGNTVLDWGTGIQTGMESAIYNAEAVELLEQLLTERNLPLERLSTTTGGRIPTAQASLSTTE